MQFGFTLKPEHTLERTLALTRQAEAAGFDYGWLFDSHVLWRDPYPLLTLMAGATTRLRLGTCVTNPATREPSVTASSLAVLDELSRRPDGSRHRPRRLGPAGARQAADDDGPHRGGDPRHPGARRGRSIDVRGHGCSCFPWTRGWTLPVWVAGYGPMAIAHDRPGRGRGRSCSSPTPTSSAGSSGRYATPRSPPDGNAARSRSRPRRRPTSAPRPRPRTDTLVPGARVEPRRRPREQVPARASCPRR